MLDIFKKLFGSKESDSSKKVGPQKGNASINIEDALSKGGPKIMFTMHMFVKTMQQYDPRYEGLFHFSGKDEHADVTCLYGFNDSDTKELLPTLWQRKSFIENCRIFGCKYINFIDAKTGEKRVLDVSTVDENTLP